MTEPRYHTRLEYVFLIALIVVWGVSVYYSTKTAVGVLGGMILSIEFGRWRDES